VPTSLRNVFRVVTEVQQSIERLVGYKPNIATSSAVSTGWTTTRHKLLSTKSCNSITAMATFDTNFCAINKHLNESDARRQLWLAQASRKTVWSLAQPMR
jgi:hypothetical protein